MTLGFEEDLSPFFAEQEFAEPATVAGITLSAIFDDGYQEDVEIEGVKPQLTCQSADLPPGLADGDAVTAAGKSYTVAGIRPDGSGVTFIDLEYVSG